MSYKQVKAFSTAKAGKTKNMCLRNVRLGYEIPAKYDDAWTAWTKTQQHKDRNIPIGVSTPLYYSYITTINGVRQNYGHINVQLPDGRVWSDGEYFNSLSHYEAKKSPTFVGWGESVNGVSVIKWQDPPKTKMPPVGSKIQLIPKDTRNTYKAGTTKKAGTIRVTDNTFIYTVRGYDPVYGGRILINSASAGGDGVALALFYTNGQIIPGWRKV